MKNCPITKQVCEDPAECALAIELEDFHGCPFELAEKAIEDLKKNTLMPLALKLDEKMKKFLGGRN